MYILTSTKQKLQNLKMQIDSNYETIEITENIEIRKTFEASSLEFAHPCITNT